MRYTEIKKLLEQQELDEVRMGTSDLRKFADSPLADGIKIGIEFEMCVPNAAAEEEEPDWQYDYDQNERAWSIDDIVNFFENGEFSNMGSSSAQRAREEMWNEYIEWTGSAASQYVDDNQEDFKDNVRRTMLANYVDLDDFEDDAKEELGSMFDDPDALLEKQKELAREWVDQQIENAEGREYEDAAEEVREEMMEDFRNSGDGDEEAWLKDIGVEDMEDAERYWGYDWPHMYDANEGQSGDLGIDDVVNDFEDGTDYEAKGYSGYHGGSRSAQAQEGHWIIEPDSSIDAERGDAGLEFVSPALPLKDGLEAIKKVKEWASSAGCYTNKSTGLHMNISVPGMSIESLDYVKLALFMGDKHVLEQFGRSYNSYTKSAMDIVKQKIQENPESATALLNKMKEHLNTAASKLIHSGVTQKYTSINTKDKYVEFRGPGGDYLDEDLNKLTDTALRLAMSLRIATDENAERKEYAKKLYKLVAPTGEWSDPNNSVALFSRYSAGEIKKEELVANIRQAQTARKEKKGPEQQYWVMNKDESGGKQMVFARSGTEAILKGGKQMGYDREKSINLLRAEPFEPSLSAGEIPDSLSTSWREWLERAPDLRTTVLQDVRERIKMGERAYNDLTDPKSIEFLVKYIDKILKQREQEETPSTPQAQQVGTPAPANAEEVFNSLPDNWKNYLLNAEHYGSESLQSTIDNIANGTGHTGTDLSVEQRDLVISRIQSELRSRRATQPQQPAPETRPTPQQQEPEEPAADLDSQAHEQEPQGPLQGTADWEIWNPLTGQVISVAPNAQLAYAQSKARSQEQDLGLEAGTLAVRRRGENSSAPLLSTNESISIIRKLAGLK